MTAAAAVLAAGCSSGSEPPAAAAPAVTVTAPGPTATVTVYGPGATVTVPVPGPTTTVTAAPAGAGEGDFTQTAPIPGDGTFLVDSDVVPGRYRSRDNQACLWIRLSGTSGEPTDNIAEGYGPGTAIVSIRRGDVAFRTSGCNEWQRIG